MRAHMCAHTRAHKGVFSAGKRYALQIAKIRSAAVDLGVTGGVTESAEPLQVVDLQADGARNGTSTAEAHRAEALRGRKAAEHGCPAVGPWGVAQD